MNCNHVFSYNNRGIKYFEQDYSSYHKRLYFLKCDYCNSILGIKKQKRDINNEWITDCSYKEELYEEGLY
jgi:hypothetical protein